MDHNYLDALYMSRERGKDLRDLGEKTRRARECRGSDGSRGLRHRIGMSLIALGKKLAESGPRTEISVPSAGPAAAPVRPR